jgi:hypothetical protein
MVVTANASNCWAMFEHPASGARRARLSDLVRDSLRSGLLGGEANWLRDSRDLMVALARYHDCARRLGLDAAATFRLPRKKDRKACVT